MRGGAWPSTIFASLLVISGVANRIWEEETIQSATFAFAACVIYLAVAALALGGGREPLRRGGPEPDLRVRAIPAASLGAVLLGLGAGALGVGFVFGESIVIGGCGLLAVGGLLLARELRAQRHARRAVASETPS